MVIAEGSTAALMTVTINGGAVNNTGVIVTGNSRATMNTVSGANSGAGLRILRNSHVAAANSTITGVADPDVVVGNNLPITWANIFTGNLLSLMTDYAVTNTLAPTQLCSCTPL